MTFPSNDPYRNNPNPPDYLRDRPGLGAGAWAGIALVAMLALVGVIWAMSGEDRKVASTDAPRMEQTTPAPSTTGQGGTAVTPAPAPAPTMDPPER